MQVTNVTVTQDWVKIAESSDTAFVVTWDDRVDLEFAPTTANNPPNVRGHRLSRDSGVTRDVFKSGYVWVRVVASSHASAAMLVVSK